MKPQAIAWFDRLFMAGMAFSTVDAAIQWPILMADLDADPALARSGASLAIGIALVVLGFGLYLLLWYFVSLKASRVARWIMVVMAVLTIVSTVATFFLPDAGDSWPFLVANALFVAATVTLFLPGAADWFRPNQISPATFE